MTDVVNAISNEPGMYIFWCPGCKTAHQINSRWKFDGNMEKPTISPSILVNGRPDATYTMPRCHLFVEKGRIRFLGDCDHELKGQTVDMIPLDDV